MRISHTLVDLDLPARSMSYIMLYWYHYHFDIFSARLVIQVVFFLLGQLVFTVVSAPGRVVLALHWSFFRFISPVMVNLAYGSSINLYPRYNKFWVPT